MISRQRKIVYFVSGIIVFSGMLVVGVWFLPAVAPAWAVILWSVVWGIAAVTSVVAFIGFLRETAADVGADDHRRVSPPDTALPPATDQEHPWPVEWLAPALADAFEGTPYVVTTNGNSILIHADLADARWQHVATLHALQHAFVTRFTPTGKPGVVKRTDESRKVEVRAGIRGIGAQAAIQSGRQWSFNRRVEHGLGIDGFKKRVDYTFSTSEINEPVKEVLTRAGWRTTLDAETKGALIMAGLGASAAVLVPVGFLVKALLG